MVLVASGCVCWDVNSKEAFRLGCFMARKAVDF
jgi:hypothetical protein